MRGCLRSIVGGLVAGLILLAVLAVGGYFYFYPRIDSALADAVRRQYLLPPSAEIEFEHGSLLETYKGKVQRFKVRSKEARLEGLNISDVELDATGIQFDMTRTLVTGEAELRKVDYAKLKFRVSEASLGEHWGESLASRGVKEIDVDLGDEEITVSGEVDLKLTTVPVSAHGEFEIDGSTRIRLKVREISVGSATLGSGQLAGLVAKFRELTGNKKEFSFDPAKELFSRSIRTPVIDLGPLQMGVNVKRLEPKNGYLYVVAESARPGEKSAPSSEPTEEENGKESVGQQVEDKVKDAAKSVEDLGGKLKDKIL